MSLPCAICQIPLKNAGYEENQPAKGLEFVTYGHYGSAYFDPMDGSKIYLNLCDTCVEKLVVNGLAISTNEEL